MRYKKLIIGIAIGASAAMALIALVTQPFVIPVSSTPPQVDINRLKNHVKHLSVDFYPRSFEQEKNLNNTAGYITEKFKEVGADVSVQEFVVQESGYKNIIAHFGPSKGPLLIIGAHYDSDGDANEGAKHPLGYSLDTHTPGADDNASGIAGLLELARLLHQQPPAQPVELVAYTLEEMPYFRTGNMGSVWHARKLAREHQEVRLMLSLEMIGFFRDEKGSQHFPLPGMGFIYPDRGDFIAVVGRCSDLVATRKVKALMSGATQLPVVSINAPIVLPGIDFSDHRSYWREGYPALMITDTAFYRNPNYHGANDTYEKLDYRKMANTVQAVYAIAQHY